MKPHLISFKLCPFVQRAVIVLEEKQSEREVTYIDLKAKPDWFLRLSPRGKVPVLLVGETPLFESQAICEYLEEALPTPPLMPRDLVERARVRASFAFAGEDLFAPYYGIATATDEVRFGDVKRRLEDRLDRLEVEMTGRTWLTGDGTGFGMADVAVAPLFTRLAMLREYGGLDLLTSRPSLAAWSERTLSRPSLARSVPPDFVSLSLAEARHSGAVWLRGR